MKNIILIGASRAGKSTFSKMLNDRLGNVTIIQTDLLRLAFRDAIYKDSKVSTSIVGKDKDYLNYILSYYKYANMYDIDNVKVVDTVDFEPKDCSLFENSIAICFGYPNITKEEVVSNWKKYDTELDWTKNKSDEKLLTYAESEIRNSKYLEDESKKHNIRFVDTSKNRNEVLKELLGYIIEEIKIERHIVQFSFPIVFGSQAVIKAKKSQYK